MDESFTDRVDKIFGSLSSSSSSTPWSLTDAQVERRLWNRRDPRKADDDQTPISSSFDNLFDSQRIGRKRRQDLTADEQQSGDDEDTENDRDEWDIRSSIGLDSTLDNEEEEDAYDKMAEGRENAGERLYMKDITDHGPYLNAHNVLPSSVEDVTKDPRANHDAAKTRLMEDADASDEPGSSQIADEPMLNAEEPCATVAASDIGTKIKSILKRKSDTVAKSVKRVRFDSTCKVHFEATDTMQLRGEGDASVLPENGVGVPDYILNPSKYTRYSFEDSSPNVNEESNRQACLDFLESVKKHVGLEQKSSDTSADLPKSVTFIPRKKRGDSEGSLKQSSTTQAASGVSIAAEEVLQDSEITAMQEDETYEAAVCSKTKSRKPGRRYRTKPESEDGVS